MDMTSYIIGRKSAGGGSDITIDDVIAITGELDNLSTTDKSNLVNAINEVANSSGDAITFVDTSRFYLSGHKKGIYFLSATNTNVYFDETYNSSMTLSPFDGLLYLLKDVDDTIQDKETFGIYLSFTNSGWEEVRFLIRDTSGVFANAGYRVNSTLNSVQVVTANTNQSITGKKTFETLPEASIAPTTNNQLANKKYVDDAVASAGGGSDLPIYVLDVTNELNDGMGMQYFSDDETSKYIEIINDAYTKGYKSIAIMLRSTKSGRTYMFYSNSTINTNSSPSFYSDVTPRNRQYYNEVVIRLLYCRVNWIDNVCVKNGNLYVDPTRINYLQIYNQNQYNVVYDYQPAHKKYVDDAISAEIGNINTILATLTTPSNGGA